MSTCRSGWDPAEPCNLACYFPTLCTPCAYCKVLVYLSILPPQQPYKDAQQFNEQGDYRSAIGLLTYLACNTCPDLEYAVHMCVHFQADPHKLHGNAIKGIGRYLFKTKDKGIQFQPSNNINTLECYVDANFAGAYYSTNNEDPNGVCSDSGCVLMFANYIITWFSRL
eukprot:5763998-Ditylum_brightwellii.AAC.1